MLGIVVSRADSASVHVGEQLRELEEWDVREDDSLPDSEGGGTVYETGGAQLREFDALHLDLFRPADAFDEPALLVFVSRHSGETGSLLTAHHTGNVGPADHGGAANELAEACPNALAAVHGALERHAPEGYDVGIECTHHGPSDVGAPSMFVEVGSARPQWEDPDAARAVARAVLDIRGVDPHQAPETGDRGGSERRRQLVGVGGSHYAPRFERVLEETEWAVGHVLADWGLDTLGFGDGSPEDPDAAGLFEEAFEKSEAAYALVDGDHPRVRSLIEELGYRAVSETWLRETDDVDLGFVRAVEAEVTTVDEGLRFGRATGTPPASFEVVDLPAELLEEARAIDREAAFEVLVETTLAFGTDQGGTRPAGPAVLQSKPDREAVVDGLLSVLESKYDSVERDGDEAVARRRVFDPEKAHTLGIPEGPAFGRLAAGEPVEVGGETIHPDVVHDERTSRFSLTL